MVTVMAAAWVTAEIRLRSMVDHPQREYIHAPHTGSQCG
jgi:hypothetical protein